MTKKLTVYRRDYCGYCMRLERALHKAEVPYERRDIYADPEAAAFVRSVNNGDETVPTVVIGDGDVRTNPDPDQLLRDLGYPPKSSLWDRLTGHHADDEQA
ncbi:MAG: glutaredoxin domain-containing protein [Nakamurella sp.]